MTDGLHIHDTPPVGAAPDWIGECEDDCAPVDFLADEILNPEQRQENKRETQARQADVKCHRFRLARRKETGEEGNTDQKHAEDKDRMKAPATHPGAQ